MTPGPDYFARLLRYDAWANTETLGSLRRGEVPSKGIRWMGHIVGAGALWLARLHEVPPTIAVWPELSVDDCATGIGRLAEGWHDYLEGLAADDLGEPIGYRNSLGEYWTSSVGDILTHVTMHGAYHRAQIAAVVRESGGMPAYIDFIHATRQGLIP